MIQSLLVLNIDGYNPKPWHGTLLVIAIAFVSVGFNTLLARKLPLLEIVLVVLHLLGIAIVIPQWALSPKKAGGAPFTEYYNGGGWSSKGVSAMIGMLPAANSLLGLDCSIHMGKLCPPFST
jgi:hypothetical protein